MTLVAGFKGNGIPFLIGDLLVTSGDLHEYPNVNQFFTKKVHKISDNFVVAWSGNRIAAKVILTSLHERFNNKHVTKLGLEEFWRNYDEQGDLLTFVIGWIADEEPQFFRLNNQYRNEVFYESFGINGSENAERLFQDFLDENGNFIINNSNPSPLLIDGREIDQTTLTYRWFSAITSILMKTSRFMVDEAGRRQNRRNGFGGHYEILYFDGEKFCYLNSVQYLIYSFVYDERSNNWLCFSFLTFGYRVNGGYQVASTSSRIRESFHTENVWICPHVSDKLFILPDEFPTLPNYYDFNSVICEMHVITKAGDRIRHDGVQVFCGSSNEVMEYDLGKDSLSVRLSTIRDIFYSRAMEAYNAEVK